MNTPVIIDIVVAAVLLGFAAWGAHRGLFRTAAGLVIVVAALVGAGIVANTLTPMASMALQPVIEKHVESRIDKALSGEGSVRAQEPSLNREKQDAGSMSLDDLLDLLGIDADAAEHISEKAKEQMRDTGADILTAVIQSVAESILHAVLFLLSFVVILVALKLAARVLDLALKLPGLHAANALGGAAGLVEGVLAMFLAVWVMRRLGVSFDTAAVEETYLLSFFTTHTPLSALSFLR